MRIKKVSQTTPTQGQFVNGFSTSTTDGYPCDYINRLNTYSIDEQRIGTYLGKPYYRKVLIGTLPVGAGEQEFTFSNIEIKNFYGKIKSTAGSTFLINTYYKPYPEYSISGWVNTNGNLQINCGTNYSTSSQYEITIEYTKTTD